MAVKNVDLNVLIRDPEGNIVSTENALGTTEDEGVTVVVPVGYVPHIGTVPIADVSLTLIPLPEVKPPASVVGRSDDFEAGNSTIIFAFPT
jgi:hypothetical protein